jgi:hypothetical protein
MIRPVLTTLVDEIERFFLRRRRRHADRRLVVLRHVVSKTALCPDRGLVRERARAESCEPAAKRDQQLTRKKVDDASTAIR